MRFMMMVIPEDIKRQLRTLSPARRQCQDDGVQQRHCRKRVYCSRSIGSCLRRPEHVSHRRWQSNGYG